MKFIKRISRYPAVPVFFTTLTVFLLAKSISLSSIILSPSMEPALMTGDCVVFVKTRHYSPKRGDIVLFPFQGEKFAKRVIGLPGETVTISNGSVLINGSLLREDYLPEHAVTASAPDGQEEASSVFPVPDDSVFLLGDNREDSYDSRFWEDPYIPLSSIEGRFWFRY